MGTRILLADDHLIVRQGLKALLEREGLEVVGEAADGQEAVRQVQALRPDVAVLDLTMPRLNGLDAARVLAQQSPRTRVILLTVHTEDHYVLEAMRVGVRGYVVKTQVTADLVEAIREVVEGAVYLSPRISRAVVEAYLAGPDGVAEPLTSREREVLQLVAEGKKTREVARALGISVKTAESHRSRIMEKLDIHETASLVRYAIRRGLIEP
jgi:DNA-binding NarL/FixJ family response regulator